MLSNLKLTFGSTQTDWSLRIQIDRDRERREKTGWIRDLIWNVLIIWIPLLSVVEKFQRDPNFKKQNVPKRDEKPIHGLVSDKNFIVANAVENILAGKFNLIRDWRYRNRFKFGSFLSK